MFGECSFYCIFWDLPCAFISTHLLFKYILLIIEDSTVILSFFESYATLFEYPY